MTFKKLALVSAIAIAPMASYAVESLDDAALSQTTGQDGIVLELDLAVSTNTLVHDKDGLSGLSSAPGYSFDGAIVIEGMGVTANDVIVSIDAGSNDTSAGNPVLNVRVNLSTGVSLTTGAIRVGNSNRDNAAWGTSTQTNTIVSSTTLTMGATTLDVQLGATEPQGAMVVLDAAITGGVTLAGLGISDLSSLGEIGSSTLHMEDNAGTGDLTVDMDINVSGAGLVIDINQLGSATGMDVQIVDQYLGSVGAGIIGDIEMQGLDLAGTQITIHGK